MTNYNKAADLSFGELLKDLSGEVNSYEPKPQVVKSKDQPKTRGNQNLMTYQPLVNHLDEALTSIREATNTGDVDSEQAIRLLVAYEIIENVKSSL